MGHDLALYIAILSAILSLLVGSGVIFRLLAHNRNQAVQEYRLNETVGKMDAAQKEISGLQTAQALTNQSIEQMGRKLEKLDLLETVHAQMQVVIKILDNTILRPEADAKFKGIEARVESVESAVFHKE